jgi:hypothetical protein
MSTTIIEELFLSVILTELRGQNLPMKPNNPQQGSGLIRLLPVWGLASAGGALGFFGGMLLPENQGHTVAVAVGILLGTVLGGMIGLR